MTSIPPGYISPSPVQLETQLEVLPHVEYYALAVQHNTFNARSTTPCHPNNTASINLHSLFAGGSGYCSCQQGVTGEFCTIMDGFTPLFDHTRGENKATTRHIVQKANSAPSSMMINAVTGPEYSCPGLTVLDPAGEQCVCSVDDDRTCLATTRQIAFEVTHWLLKGEETLGTMLRNITHTLAEEYLAIVNPDLELYSRV